MTEVVHSSIGNRPTAMQQMEGGSGQQSSFEIFEDGTSLTRCTADNGGTSRLPMTPAEDSKTSFKVQRRGSKIMSVLRSLTNSVSNTSTNESAPSATTVPPNEPCKKFSMGLLMVQNEPTVVHRTHFKSRPSIISIERTVDVIVETSPSTSAGDSSSGKSSGPGAGESTAKTSLDSKMSINSKGPSQHSSEKRKTPSKHSTAEGAAAEPLLKTIAEVEWVDKVVPPKPTIVTVEKAAAAKVFFEMHYNNLTTDDLTPRSLRRRHLEAALYVDVTLSDAEKEEKRLRLIKKESDNLRETRVLKAHATQIPTASRYEVVKVLGKGSFGVVRLVREKPVSRVSGSEPRKEIYAMKVIRKSDMLRNSQEGHLRAERDFLVAAEGSRWVVPLMSSFQDSHNLYLVMDYMPGGDFLGLLIRENVLSEPVTKFYIAEMILCIEEAHALTWIHRDVKPDNFLISASGHLKISDFGLAFDGHWSHDQSYYNNHRYSLLSKLGIKVKGDSVDEEDAKNMESILKTMHFLKGIKEKHEWNSSKSEGGGILNWRNRRGNRSMARSVVGTSQYMAPEVVRGDAYDARCDWWSVAVILYECLYGHTPFLSEEGGRQQTKANIMNHAHTFGFPHKPIVSRRCQDLIKSMIKEREHRLCSKKYKNNKVSSGNRDSKGRFVFPNDAEDIKAHKWFRDMPWEHLHMMTPPFVPNITSMDDTHYFDEEESISDFSESFSIQLPDPDEIGEALKPFRKEIVILAIEWISCPQDSLKRRKIEKEIDKLNSLTDEEKAYLKEFIKRYGRKEKKRPRDRLLRDMEMAPKVLELRKSGAFLGYTYRRFRMGKESLGKAAAAGLPAVVVGSSRRTVRHRARLSIN